MKDTYGDLGVHSHNKHLTSGVKAHRFSRRKHRYSDVGWDFFLHRLLECQDNVGLHVSECRNHHVSGLLRSKCVGEVDAMQQVILACKIGVDTALRTTDGQCDMM